MKYAYLEVLQSVIVRLSQKLLSRWKIDVNKSKFKENANFNSLIKTCLMITVCKQEDEAVEEIRLSWRLLV